MSSVPSSSSSSVDVRTSSYFSPPPPDESSASSGSFLSLPPHPTSAAARTMPILETVEDIGVGGVEALRERRKLPPAHQSHHARPHRLRVERALLDVDVLRRPGRVDGQAHRDRALLGL